MEYRGDSDQSGKVAQPMWAVWRMKPQMISNFTTMHNKLVYANMF